MNVATVLIFKASVIARRPKADAAISQIEKRVAMTRTKRSHCDPVEWALH